MDLMQILQLKQQGAFNPNDLLVAANGPAQAPSMPMIEKPEMPINGPINLPKKAIEYSVKGSGFNGQYGDQFDNAFYESMGLRKQDLDKMREKLSTLEGNAPTGLAAADLRPLLAFGDQMAGTNNASMYSKPQAVTQHNEKLQRLQDAISKNENNLSDDQLNYLKTKMQEENYRIRESNAANAASKAAQNKEFALRGEWSKDPITKNSKTIAEGYQKIHSGYNSSDPASYLTMIYGLMRMQDPQSTVRESEFQTGENIGGWPEKWKAMYQKAVGDMRGPITQVQKDAILSQARGLYGAQLERQKSLDDDYKRLSLGYGFNPRNVVLEDVLKPTEGTMGNELKVGTVQDGHQYIGGDPSNPNSWKVVK